MHNSASSFVQSSRSAAASVPTAARLLPPAGLFLAAPLVAEYLLGNMSIAHLGILAVLAPLYGGAALLIREAARRTGRGWGSVFLLALAYGVLEEAFLTQSLFNPDYLGQRLHLLAPAPLPALGMGARYTVFVLTLHTVWSIPVPIALVEALAPARARAPWLSKTGIAIVAVAFAAASWALARFSVRADAQHFVASPQQFIGAGFFLLVLVLAAFMRRGRKGATSPGRQSRPLVQGLVAFVLGSVFLLIPGSWAWGAVLAYLLLDLVAIFLLVSWSRTRTWSAIDRLSVAAGAAMAYAGHAFFEIPSLGDAGAATRLGNLFFALLALAVVAAGAGRTGRHAARAQQA